jgi:c-di-GMP-binding flagellar brake protein YcgR
VATTARGRRGPDVPYRENDLVQIEVPGFGAPKIYKSRIERLEMEALVLQAPLDRNGQAVHLDRGSEVGLLIEHGKRAFSAKAEVIGGDFDNVPLLVVKHPVLREVSRRHWFRVEVDLAMIVNEQVIARAKNLSGGGLFAEFPDGSPIAMGQAVDVELGLPGKGPLRLKARVVLVRSLGAGRIGAGFEFQAITPTAREQIVRYVFEVEREWLKKGIRIEE